MVDFLLHINTAALNLVNNEGETSLHLAAWVGCFKVIELLLQQKPEIKLANNGYSCLHYAEWALDVAKSMEEWNVADNLSYVFLVSMYIIKDYQTENDLYVKEPSIYQASKAGDFGRVKKLAKAGVDVDKPGPSSLPDNGQSPLQAAIRQAYNPIAKYLLQEYSNVEFKDLSGLTPFLTACEADNVEMVTELLFGDVNTRAVTSEGFSCLYYACLNGSYMVAASLILYRAVDINAVNNYGQTALHIAAEHGKYKTVQLLLQQTPLITSDHSGRSALDVCAKRLGLMSSREEITEAEAQLLSQLKKCVAAIEAYVNQTSTARS